jgi:hypothetical protein
MSTHGVSFLSGGAVVKTHGKQIFEVVNAAQRSGKTFYFLATSQVTTSATGKAEDTQLYATLNTIALR